ncbi:MAG: YaaR family protein [Bacillota bacterium]|nr:YaaR family protein [Bacillota bacterium]
MRVSKSGSRQGKSIIDGKKRKGTQGSAPVEVAFPQILHLEQIEQMDLVQALEEVDEHARRLKRSPVLENLLRYKSKVSALLRFLVKQSYSVEENSFYDPHGRRRLLMIVENIDQKLEALTRDLLNKQTDSLDLVSRLDEIRGMLLDLYT